LRAQYNALNVFVELHNIPRTKTTGPGSSDSNVGLIVGLIILALVLLAIAIAARPTYRYIQNKKYGKVDNYTPPAENDNPTDYTPTPMMSAQPSQFQPDLWATPAPESPKTTKNAKPKDVTMKTTVTKNPDGTTTKETVRTEIKPRKAKAESPDTPV
jgi:cytoskeletal protein RodZ